MPCSKCSHDILGSQTSTSPKVGHIPHFTLRANVPLYHCKLYDGFIFLIQVFFLFSSLSCLYVEQGSTHCFDCCREGSGDYRSVYDMSQESPKVPLSLLTHTLRYCSRFPCFTKLCDFIHLPNGTTL